MRIRCYPFPCTLNSVALPSKELQMLFETSSHSGDRYDQSNRPNLLCDSSVDSLASRYYAETDPLCGHSHPTGSSCHPRLFRRILSSVAAAVTLLIFVPIAAAVTKSHRLLLAIIVLNVPFRVGAHLFYRQDLADRGAQAGLDISLSTVATIVLCVIWLIKYTANRRSGPPAPKVSVALLGYAGFAVISLVTARNRTLGLFEL